MAGRKATKYQSMRARAKHLDKRNVPPAQKNGLTMTVRVAPEDGIDFSAKGHLGNKQFIAIVGTVVTIILALIHLALQFWLTIQHP